MLKNAYKNIAPKLFEDNKQGLKKLICKVIWYLCNNLLSFYIPFSNY